IMSHKRLFRWLTASLTLTMIILLLSSGWHGTINEADALQQTATATATTTRQPNDTSRLILATTTSTYDSGLLGYILPVFEKQFNAKVDIVSVGSGQAFKLGQNGDADVLLVHARDLEEKFVKDGFGTKRYDVMYNDFIIIGPPDDPAKIKGMKDAVA